jgi:hypothetical protein
MFRSIKSLLVRQRHVQERAAVADTGVERDRGHIPAGGRDRLQQPLDAAKGGQVGPHRLDVRPGRGEIVDGGHQLAVFGGDDHVEAVGGELTGQLTADTARCAGDDGKRF